jgi:hypothetical protein
MAERNDLAEGATQTHGREAHQPRRVEEMDKRNKVGTASPEFARILYDARLAGKTWPQIGAEFGLYTKTAQAILRRHGYNHSPNGANKKKFDLWDRPCSNCGKKEKRSRGLFRCKECRKTAREEFNAPDIYYQGVELVSTGDSL